jgi:hypothetical protein
MWFRLLPADLPWTVGAPWRFHTVVEVDAPGERVFAAFADPEQMAAWLPGFRHCRYQTPAPRGVGSARELRMTGVSFREHFLAWEPAARFCFAIDQMTLPLMRRMVEDVQIDPLPGGRSRVVWTVYYQPGWLTWLVHPLARLGFELGYQRSMQALARHLEVRAWPKHSSPAAPASSAGTW